MARFAIVEGGVVTNIIEASEEYGNKIGGIYVDDHAGVFIGDTYADGVFSRNGVEIARKVSTADLIAQLQDENAFLALELATTQARLDQTEQEHADLLLMLVSQGVI